MTVDDLFSGELEAIPEATKNIIGSLFIS